MQEGFKDRNVEKKKGEDHQIINKNVLPER